MSADGVAGPFLDSARFFNAGWTVVGSPDGIIQLGPNPPGSFESNTIVTLSNDSAAQLGGGASVQMQLVRSAASVDDTCTNSIFAEGGYSVEY